MEGAYCDLRSVVRIAKQYGASLYLDEAHSIGAVSVVRYPPWVLSQYA